MAPGELHSNLFFRTLMLFVCFVLRVTSVAVIQTLLLYLIISGGRELSSAGNQSVNVIHSRDQR
jgi:hypothetical protein